MTFKENFENRKFILASKKVSKSTEPLLQEGDSKKLQRSKQHEKMQERIFSLLRQVFQKGLKKILGITI